MTHPNQKPAPPVITACVDSWRFERRPAAEQMTMLRMTIASPVIAL